MINVSKALLTMLFTLVMSFVVVGCDSQAPSQPAEPNSTESPMQEQLDAAKEEAEAVMDEAADQAESVGESVEEAADEVADQAEEAMGEVSEQAEDAAESRD